MKTSTPTILIVDDNPHDLFLIEKVFREIDVKVSTHQAGGGQEAIAYLMGLGKYSDRSRYAYPTLITTDLEMPGTDGFDVLKVLKNNPVLAFVPIVVLSSSRDVAHIRKAYRLGASSYQVKPNSIDGLRRQLKVLHEYWMACELPAVDGAADRRHSHGAAKVPAKSSLPVGAA
jgi:CheY-like chemotaxis protein